MCYSTAHQRCCPRNIFMTLPIDTLVEIGCSEIENQFVLCLCQVSVRVLWIPSLVTIIRQSIQFIFPNSFHVAIIEHDVKRIILFIALHYTQELHLSKN